MSFFVLGKMRAYFTREVVVEESQHAFHLSRDAFLAAVLTAAESALNYQKDRGTKLTHLTIEASLREEYATLLAEDEATPQKIFDEIMVQKPTVKSGRKKKGGSKNGQK